MSGTDFDRRLNDWFDAVEPTHLPPALLPQVLSAVQQTRQVRGPWSRLTASLELTWPPRSRVTSSVALVVLIALLIVALVVAGVAAGWIRLPSKTGTVDGLIAVENWDQSPLQIRFIDPRTGQDAFVTPTSVNACGAHFSPDGSRYAFLREDAPGEISIVVAPAAGDFQPTLLKRKPFQLHFDPSWAPDGSALVAPIETDGGYDELWLLPADGTPGRRVTQVEASFIADWSASGEWIAFVGAGPVRPLYVIRRDGSDLRLLRPHGVDWATWSPVRDELAYDSAEDGQLHVISLDGSETFAMHDGRIPSGDQVIPDAKPIWSDDGTKVALALGNYPLDPRGMLKVFDLRAASSAKIPLPERISSAVWSATGSSMAVVTWSQDGTSGNLWEVFIDGRQPRLIAQGVRSGCMSGGAALDWQRLSK